MLLLAPPYTSRHGAQFIPAKHPLLKGGSCTIEGAELSHFELFRLNVVSVLRDLLDDKPNVKIVLVPSLEDAIADHVFPQPPFSTLASQVSLFFTTFCAIVQSC